MNQERAREKSERIGAQEQDHQPGSEDEMRPPPTFIRDSYRGSEKLDGKVAIVTGADSGIGRAVAIHFAREGADVAGLYLTEDDDAQETRDRVEAEGQECLLIEGDVRDSASCEAAVERTVEELGEPNVLVNNAGTQVVETSLTDITDEQWAETFETNVNGYFYMARAVLPHLGTDDAIINTTSVNAYEGNAMLIDYSSTKGAIVGFTRALSQQLAADGIRVNQVAPGPIWTPLIPATIGQHDADAVEKFGEDVPMGRAGQPCELGPAYVYLACQDSSYMSGQTLHVNGGSIVNG